MSLILRTMTSSGTPVSAAGLSENYTRLILGKLEGMGLVDVSPRGMIVTPWDATSYGPWDSRSWRSTIQIPQ